MVWRTDWLVYYLQQRVNGSQALDGRYGLTCGCWSKHNTAESTCWKTLQKNRWITQPAYQSYTLSTFEVQAIRLSQMEPGITEDHLTSVQTENIHSSTLGTEQHLNHQFIPSVAVDWRYLDDIYYDQFKPDWYLRLSNRWWSSSDRPYFSDWINSLIESKSCFSWRAPCTLRMDKTTPSRVHTSH